MQLRLYTRSFSKLDMQTPVLNMAFFQLVLLTAQEMGGWGHNPFHILFRAMSLPTSTVGNKP